jgi:hypothetical protein
MAFIPVPFEAFQIESDLAPDGVVETLQREAPQSDFWCWECEHRYHVEMKRKFDLDLRRANPNVHIRIKPTSAGSTIQVKINFGLFQGFLFFGLMTLLILIVIWAFFSFFIYGSDIRIFLIACLGLFSVYFFGAASFKFEADLARKFLSRLFRHSEQLQSQ